MKRKPFSPLLSRPPPQPPVYLAILKTSIILKISFLMMNDCNKIFYFILKGRLYDSVEKKKNYKEIVCGSCKWQVLC